MPTDMPTPIFESSRNFQMWMYSVGHSVLLWRSVKDESNPTRIDLLFKPTSFVGLCTKLSGIVIRVIEPAPSLPIPCAALSSDTRIFEVLSQGVVGHIAADAFFMHEDDKDYGDPSFFDVPRLVW